MARRGMNYPKVVGVRLTDEDIEKLDRLATLTYRGRADVLRCLIHQADVATHSDLMMSGMVLPATAAEVGEVIHAG